MALTNEQFAAVTAPQSVAAVASAGTGKTTVLTERFVQILQSGVPPHRILAFTFTEKATREMKSRILKSSRLGIENTLLLNISTIHSFLAQLLKKYGSLIGLASDFAILDDQAFATELKTQVREFVREALLKMDSIFFPFYKNYGLRNLTRSVAELVRMNLLIGPPEELRCLGSHEQQHHFYNDFLARNLVFQNRLIAVRTRAKTLTYDDLETLALKLFAAHPSITRKLQGLYNHILVDEFQDLSPQQCTLISTLFEPKQNDLFIVGDPKQSIYGFRHADAHLFSTMANTIIESGGKTVVLSETFRTPTVVQGFFNDVFPKILNRDGSEIFQATRAHHKESFGGIYAPFDYDADSSAAEIIAGHVTSLSAIITDLCAQGVSSSSIAILSSTRKHFPLLKTQLARLGVATVTEARASHFDEPSVLFIYHALLYLGGHREKIVLAGLLRNPLLDFSEPFVANALRAKDNEDIFLATTPPDGDEKDQALWSNLVNALKLWQSATEINFARELAWSIFMYILPTPNAHDLNVMQKFSGILETWQKQGFTTVSVITTLLRELAENGAEYTPPEDSQDGVRLLTVHAAKGLEFDHVFLIPGGERRNDSSVFIRKKGEGFLFKTADALRAVSLKYELDSPVEFDDFKSTLKNEEDAETARLIYVAMTRTLHNLFIFPPKPRNKSLAKQLRAAPGSTDGIRDFNSWLCWLTRQGGVKPLADFNAVSAGIPVGVGSKPTHHYVANLRAGLEPAPTKSQHPLLTVTELEIFNQCPKRFELAYLNGLRPLRSHTHPQHTGEVTIDFDKSKITSVERGNLIHEILQFYSPMRNNLENVIDQALFNQHLTDPSGKIRAECHTQITKLERSTEIDKILFSDNKSYSEFEFTLALKDFILSGQIDKLALIATPDGAHWSIVDYKTHQTDSAAERDELAEQFKFQMLCYALAVQDGFDQDTVDAIIVFTDAAEVRRFHFTSEELNNFRLQLEELCVEIFGNTRKKDFHLTSDRILCEACPYYADNYCGARD